MTTNPDDLRFRRTRLALAGIKTIDLDIADSPEAIGGWLQAYDPGGPFPTKVDGLRLMVERFTLMQRTVLADVLEARALGIRWDPTEQANRMEPIGAVRCELEPLPDGSTTVLFDWTPEVSIWCRNWLACLFADMDRRWPGVADQVGEAAEPLVAQVTEATAAEPTNGEQPGAADAPLAAISKAKARRAVTLWLDGETQLEALNHAGFNASGKGTAANSFSRWRAEYGEQVVPTNEERQSRLRAKRKQS